MVAMPSQMTPLLYAQGRCRDAAAPFQFVEMEPFIALLLDEYPQLSIGERIAHQLIPAL